VKVLDLGVARYPRVPILGEQITLPVYAAAFSPDGKSVVTASYDTTARLWDSATGEPLGQAHLDIPKRLHKDIRYLDETVCVDGYDGVLRQIAVGGLGRELYTLFLSNNSDVTAREVVLRYTSRNCVEDGLGISVNFFHLDCLASEVRLNVDLDVALTVIANGCYRWLAEKLHGFAKAKPKDLYRKFIETGGGIEIKPSSLVIHFDRRAHNPILREANLDHDCPPIPWLGHRRVLYNYS
jgi:hypothetical protein